VGVSLSIDVLTTLSTAITCNSLYPISGKRLLVYSFMKTLQTLRYLFSSYPVWVIASQKNSPRQSVRARFANHKSISRVTLKPKIGHNIKPLAALLLVDLPKVALAIMQLGMNDRRGHRRLSASPFGFGRSDSTGTAKTPTSSPRLPLSASSSVKSHLL
jgi:hypothetical protein